MASEVHCRRRGRRADEFGRARFSISRFMATTRTLDSSNILLLGQTAPVLHL